jgi:hypothetical protein
MAPTRLKSKEVVNLHRSHSSSSRPQLDNVQPNSPDDGSREKDETEKRLEKLLFGDDAGFFEGLKAHSADQQLEIRPESSEEGSGDDEQGGFGSVADENVRTGHWCRKHPQADRFTFVMHTTLKVTMRTRAENQPGSIAMMIGYVYLLPPMRGYASCELPKEKT